MFGVRFVNIQIDLKAYFIKLRFKNLVNRNTQVSIFCMAEIFKF